MMKAGARQLEDTGKDFFPKEKITRIRDEEEKYQGKGIYEFEFNREIKKNCSLNLQSTIIIIRLIYFIVTQFWEYHFERLFYLFVCQI